MAYKDAGPVPWAHKALHLAWPATIPWLLRWQSSPIIGNKGFNDILGQELEGVAQNVMGPWKAEDVLQSKLLQPNGVLNFLPLGPCRWH